MKIRRYVGKDTQEAILKVKMDLGNDAIILNTKKVRQKGLTKLFSKPWVEVLAAIDDEYGGRKAKTIPKQEEKMEVPVQVRQIKNTAPQAADKISELENKVVGMESMLKKVYSQIQMNGIKTGTSVQEEQNGEEYPKYLKLIYNNLLKNEVEQEIAKKIIEIAKEKMQVDASIHDTASIVYKIVNDMLGKSEVIQMREDGKPTVVLFVGSTGVGKTTTVAKIAANYAINQGKNVGLITADTYRIAAVEQLKTYAEILGMPISVVYSPEEVNEAVNNYSEKDIVLIDTPGRSYRNKAQYKEVLDLINEAKPDEIYLLVSTTTSTRHIREVLGNYGFLEKYKLIFTKVDETPVNGVILNTRYITNKSLSYITTGQSVPDDIEIADTDKITKNLIGSMC